MANILALPGKDTAPVDVRTPASHYVASMYSAIDGSIFDSDIQEWSDTRTAIAALTPCTGTFDQRMQCVDANSYIAQLTFMATVFPNVCPR